MWQLGVARLTVAMFRYSAEMGQSLPRNRRPSSTVIVSGSTEVVLGLFARSSIFRSFGVLILAVEVSATPLRQLSQKE